MISRPSPGASETTMAPLDESERSTLESVLARIIPSDEIGPGAPEAQVLRYVCRALDSDYAGEISAYRDGIAALDACSQATHGTRFASLTEEQQDSILSRAEVAERDGDAAIPPGFFELVRRHAIEGMFADPHWGGNADRVGWALIGYPGPRAVWSAQEQEIEDKVVPAPLHGA
jgi:gluconate 2-dehydrogenase gamma chain